MICKKCNQYFPGCTKINGKTISLYYRSYCLSCSPYKGNTKNIILPPKKPSLPENFQNCPSCKTIKPVSEFYGRNPKTNKIYSWCKSCYKLQAKRRQWEFKNLCVKHKGGKCIKCGYDKNTAALEFHHKDPAKKEFSISKSRDWKFNEVIFNELDKCDLLCSNCHREEHGIEYETFMKEIQILQDSRMPTEPVTKTCLCCQKQYIPNISSQMYCSHNCATFNSRKVERPLKEQLEQEITNFSFSELGRKYKVTDNTIRKWVRFYGLDLTKAKGFRHKIAIRVSERN